MHAKHRHSVLQVLLSQAHRQRALILLCRFLDQGCTTSVLFSVFLFICSACCQVIGRSIWRSPSACFRKKQKLFSYASSFLLLNSSTRRFSYVLKLLQSPAPELRAVLVIVIFCCYCCRFIPRLQVFIWTKLLALDRSCQVN